MSVGPILTAIMTTSDAMTHVWTCVDPILQMAESRQAGPGPGPAVSSHLSERDLQKTSTYIVPCFLCVEVSCSLSLFWTPGTHRPCTHASMWLITLHHWTKTRLIYIYNHTSWLHADSLRIRIRSVYVCHLIAVEETGKTKWWHRIYLPWVNNVAFQYTQQIKVLCVRCLCVFFFKQWSSFLSAADLVCCHRRRHTTAPCLLPR